MQDTSLQTAIEDSGTKWEFSFWPPYLISNEVSFFQLYKSNQRDRSDGNVEVGPEESKLREGGESVKRLGIPAIGVGYLVLKMCICKEDDN